MIATRPPRIGVPEAGAYSAATALPALSIGDQEHPHEPVPPEPVVLFADVVVPGKALITSGDGAFSGTVIRDRERGSGYLVEDEWGEVVGRARTYRDGAARLAGHHGRRVARVEVDFETAEQTRADRQSGGAR